MLFFTKVLRSYKNTLNRMLVRKRDDTRFHGTYIFHLSVTEYPLSLPGTEKIKAVVAEATTAFVEVRRVCSELCPSDTDSILATDGGRCLRCSSSGFQDRCSTYGAGSRRPSACARFFATEDL